MYGLTKKNKEQVLDKIEKQKDFLYSHYIEVQGEKVQLASFFKNTFINADRYIAELQHRVWSLVSYAQDKDLVNVFLTLTLPSEYHPKKTLRNGKIIDNPKYAHKNIVVYDIFTKEKSTECDIFIFKKYTQSKLKYWNGCITATSLLFKKNMIYDIATKKPIRLYDDLLKFIGNDNINSYLRLDLEIYDIATKKRVLDYTSFSMKHKDVSLHTRFTGKVKTISLVKEDYTPANASKVLTDMFTKIRKDRSYQDLDKDERVYFRVTEPHKDGTPHLHISLWLPKERVARFVQAVHRLYPAPMADIATTYIPQGYELYEKVYKRNGTWNFGYKAHKDDKSYIKLQIEDSVSYLMKYIYKTLDDLRDNKGITEITMWYILHGICRFYTSRTLISLNVYRPLGGKLSLLELTQHYKDETVTVWLDPENNQPKMIQYDDVILWNKKEFELKQYDKDDNKSQGTMSIRTVDIEIDGEEYYMFRAGTKLHHKETYSDISDAEYITPVTRMKMVQLFNYYHSLDVDDPTLNIKHFGLVQNTMIDRGLLEGEIIPLDAFNTSFGDTYYPNIPDDEIFNPYDKEGY